MSRAWCVAVLLVAPALWAGSEPAAEPKEPRKAVGPWWVVARGGGYTLGGMFGSTGGELSPVDESFGGIGLEIRDGLLVGVGGGRWINRWLAIEASLARFDVELRGNDFFEEHGLETPVEIGTGTLNAAQLTLLFECDLFETGAGEAKDDSERRNRFVGFIGVNLLYEKPGGFDLAEAGQSLLGIVEVETRSVMLWGVSLRGDIPLGRAPWALTLDFALDFFGRCETPFVVRTNPEAGFQSGGASFAPITFTVGVLRRF